MGFQIRKVDQVMGRSAFRYRPSRPSIPGSLAEFFDLLCRAPAMERVPKERLIPSVPTVGFAFTQIEPFRRCVTAVRAPCPGSILERSYGRRIERGIRH